MDADHGGEHRDATVPVVHDAGTDGFLVENRRIQVTMYPFWGTAPTAPAVPLEGVEVCIAGARPYGALGPFVDVGRPCAPPSVLRQNIVLSGVPASAEVLMTASLAGYRPSLYPVTTWTSDQSGTNPGDDYQMHLTPEGALSALNPSFDSSAGAIEVTVGAACALFDPEGFVCNFASGATVALDPPGASDSGPYYTLGGNLVPGTRSTLGGQLIVNQPSTAKFPNAIFTNLREREYTLRIDYPFGTCRVFSATGLPFGFPSTAPDVIRVPILPGYTTIVVAQCACDDGGIGNDCMPRMGDGGAP